MIQVVNELVSKADGKDKLLATVQVLPLSTHAHLFSAPATPIHTSSETLRHVNLFHPNIRVCRLVWR